MIWSIIGRLSTLYYPVFCNTCSDSGTVTAAIGFFLALNSNFTSPCVYRAPTGRYWFQSIRSLYCMTSNSQKPTTISDFHHILLVYACDSFLAICLARMWSPFSSFCSPVRPFSRMFSLATCQIGGQEKEH